jgi:hypothetical protein
MDIHFSRHLKSITYGRCASDCVCPDTLQAFDGGIIFLNNILQALYGFHSLFQYLKRKGADDSITNHAGKTCYELEATFLAK